MACSMEVALVRVCRAGAAFRGRDGQHELLVTRARLWAGTWPPEPLLVHASANRQKHIAVLQDSLPDLGCCGSQKWQSSSS